MKIRTLPVDVYKNVKLGDCTNRGVSFWFNELQLFCPDGHNSFDPAMETPLNFCMVQRRHLSGGDYYNIVPAMVDESGEVVPRPGWYMYGGNIACTSDSRFYGISGCSYPLKIHDRREH